MNSPISPGYGGFPEVRKRRLGTGGIVGVIALVVVFVAVVAAGVVTLVVLNKDDGVYGANPLPTCDDLAGKITLPPKESDKPTTTGWHCRFADGTTGKSAEFELSVSTIEEQRREFRKYVEMGYLRDANDPLGDDSARTRVVGDGSTCSLVVLDSNATFKITSADPADAYNPQFPNIEPGWGCKNSVQLMWQAFYLLAIGA